MKPKKKLNKSSKKQANNLRAFFCFGCNFCSCNCTVANPNATLARTDLNRRANERMENL